MTRACMLISVLLACGGRATPGESGPPPAARPTNRAAAPITVPAEGASLRVEQRARVTLPGSSDRFEVALGDITGGQVELTIGHTDGSGVLVTRSVREGDRVPFTVEGYAYALEITTLVNVLAGTDHAQLVLRAEAEAAPAGPEPTAMSEPERIEKLLQAVAASGIVFIRNGSEHDAAEAASHLRSKWERAGDRVGTAEAFIEHIGSRSSQTGEAYRVRLPDGSEQDAGPWLAARLAEIDTGG